MSWFRKVPPFPGAGKLLAMALAATILAGCGFQPLYGGAQNKGIASEALRQVEVERIPDRIGQKLRNLLLDRISPDGRPTRPAYSLRVTTSVTRTDLGIQRDETATRALLVLTAVYELYGYAEERVVFGGTEKSTNSFNIVDSDYATASAEIDALDRAAREISDSIKNRLGLFFLRSRS